MLLQVLVEPDTPEARALVTKALGWAFENQVDEHVWTVTVPVPWAEGIGCDMELYDGRTDVRVEVEWP